MHVFFTEYSQRHEPKYEMHRGDREEYFECAQRHQLILDTLRGQWPDRCSAHENQSLDAILRIHDPDYVEFLKSAWARAQGIGVKDQMLPHVWPARTMRSKLPRDFCGQLGYYSFDSGTPICRDTFLAVVANANVAAHTMKHVMKTGETAFALCRPPGHHASTSLLGGYCYLNNAAIAAQAALDGGLARVAILDVDFHHGNGTQDIFYRRNDVLFVSIHGDPDFAYPHFLGYAEEEGEADGRSCNLNLPLPDETKWPEYANALGVALEKIDNFSPEAVIVSFGADIHEADPISAFQLTTEDLGKIGSRIQSLNLPMAVVMEGGYALEYLGSNVLSFLQGIS